MIETGSRLVLIAAAIVLAGAPASEGLAAQEPLYDLLVSSRNNHSVKRFDGQTGEYVDDLVEARAGGLEATQEVLLAPDGDLIVSGRGNSAILRFDPRTGEPEGSFTNGYVLDNPTKMTWGPDGNLYVSQWGASQSTVAVFGPDGGFLREATPDLTEPQQHAWDAGGTLYVVSYGSRDVRRFDASGAQLDVFVNDSRLEGPVGLFFDDEDHLVILDWESRTIQRYSGVDGSFIEVLVTDINRPEGWTIGPDGSVYVAEWEGNTVRRFDPETWESLGVFAQAGGLAAPNSVLFIERLADFSLTLAADRLELAPGASGSLELAIDPVREVPFPGEVAIACTSSASEVTCTPEPTTLVPGQTGGTVTLTVQSTAAAVRGALDAAFLLACAMAALLLGLGGWPGARGASGWLRWGAAAACLILVASCGSSTEPPPPPNPNGGTTARLDIVGTSGELSRSATATVVVR